MHQGTKDGTESSTPNCAFVGEQRMGLGTKRDYSKFENINNEIIEINLIIDAIISNREKRNVWVKTKRTYWINKRIGFLH